MRKFVRPTISRAVVLIAILIGLPSVGSAQGTIGTIGLQFAKRAGTNGTNVPVSTTLGHAVASFSDGSFAVTGDFNGSATWGPGEVAGTNQAGATTVAATGAKDFFLARYNADGTLRWLNTIGAPSVMTSGTGITSRDADGSVVVVGFFTGTVTFPATPTATTLTPSGSNDLFVARYNSTVSQ